MDVGSAETLAFQDLSALRQQRIEESYWDMVSSGTLSLTRPGARRNAAAAAQSGPGQKQPQPGPDLSATKGTWLQMTRCNRVRTVRQRTCDCVKLESLLCYPEDYLITFAL